MTPEDLFLHLCVHLSRHTFETSLTQIWDLAELIEAPHVPVDWTCALKARPRMEHLQSRAGGIVLRAGESRRLRPTAFRIGCRMMICTNIFRMYYRTLAVSLIPTMWRVIV